MISLDTNVLIRHLVRDDAAQFSLARKLIQDQLALAQPVLITLLVALESEWVLRSRYSIPKLDIISTFTTLLQTRELVFEEEDVLEQALFWWKGEHVNFADCLIAAKSRGLGCSALMTFDVKASRLPCAQLLVI